MNTLALTGSGQTITDEEADIRHDLVLDLEQTRDWRQKLIAKFPDDDGLPRAVQILDRLIPTIADVPSVTLLQFAQTLDDQPDDEPFNSWRKAIGFRTSPVSAEAFIKDFIANPEKFVKPR